jgi:mono/diheme cytochrome c family protein
MRLLAFIGFLAIVGVLGAAFYFLTGRFSVSAVPPDNSAVAWALQTVREKSIAANAPLKAPINADDPNIVIAGARAFSQRGCVYCHGGPGADWAKFAEGLRPDAADLNEVAKTRNVEQIFWVVKNGINMTGMPSFKRAGVGDDEIWKIAAFVKKLPGVKAEDYNSWTSPGTQ